MALATQCGGCRPAPTVAPGPLAASGRAVAAPDGRNSCTRRAAGGHYPGQPEGGGMHGEPMTRVVDALRDRLAGPAGDALPDADLLGRYLAARDEAAFAALVR